MLWTLSSISVRRDDRIYYSSIAMQQISPKIMAYRNESAFFCFLYWKSGWFWFDWVTAPSWFSEPTLMESSESTLMLLACPCGLFSWLCSVELDWEPCLEFLTMWPLPWYNSFFHSRCSSRESEWEWVRPRLPAACGLISRVPPH